MAGATGQGKSVGLNAVLTSLLYKTLLKLNLFSSILKVELTFNKIERHYLAKLPDTEDAFLQTTPK
jgi:S-DNA-T family DNA segregation ATPase FtsK/SpoIIIE